MAQGCAVGAMTGPEHYAEAERLTDAVTVPNAMNPQARALKPGNHLDVIALAQVHATLALAAAVGNNEADCGQTVDEANAWHEVSGVKS